ILGQPNPLAEWGIWEHACTSELLGLEARRLLDRARLNGDATDDQLGAFHRVLSSVERTIDILRLTRGVVQRAGLPMATAVKTLDALHLASALIWRERREPHLTFATHDPHQARAARALGFDCVGV